MGGKKGNMRKLQAKSLSGIRLYFGNLRWLDSLFCLKFSSLFPFSSHPPFFLHKRMFADFSSSSQFLRPSVMSWVICFSTSAWNLSSHFHGFHHANNNDKQIYSFISHQYVICISQSTSNSICPNVNLLISLPKLSFFTFLP